MDYKDVYMRTIEILQCAHIFKANCCLKVQDVHLKLALPILGYMENSVMQWTELSTIITSSKMDIAIEWLFYIS